MSTITLFHYAPLVMLVIAATGIGGAFSILVWIAMVKPPLRK